MRNRLMWAFLVISFLFVAQVCNAKMTIKYLSNINGLTNNSVNCIFEDSQHVVWIGTWDGLNAYNGRDIRTFRYNKNSKHTISNNIIRQIIDQDSTYLWVATDYGINRWDRNKQQFDNFFLGTKNKIPKQEKSYQIGVTSNHTIICFVREQGLFYYDNAKGVFIPISTGINLPIKDFLIDNEDNVYFLSQDGNVYASRLVNREGKIITDTPPRSIQEGIVVDKMFFSGNRLILHSLNTLTILNKRQTVIQRIQLEKDKSISHVICHKDILYIGFYEGGCQKYDLVNNVFMSVSEIPQRISIFTLYMGTQDILWVGSDGQGVQMLYEHESSFQNVYTNHPVRSFCQDATGRILVGTKGDGIKVFDKYTGVLSDFLTSAEGLASNSVYAFNKNAGGDIFIGTEGAGIHILRANNKLEKLNIPPKYPFFKAVYAIHFSNADSILWLGTSGYGLIRIYLRKENSVYQVANLKQYISSDRHTTLSNDIIYTIVEDTNKHMLWFGTRGGGLYSIGVTAQNKGKPDTKRVKVDISNNDILSLYQSHNKLWVGTGYGLNKLVWSGNSKISVSQYTDNEGLNNNTIHGILEDEAQNMWVSTNLGISYIDHATNKVKNYTLKDGLQSDEFSDGAYFKDQLNLLYFGGTNGFSYFHPQDIRQRDFTPTLSLSELKIYNTIQNIHEQIEDNVLNLSYDERYVTFTFIANDFINNENCEYRYRLLNFSDQWIDNGNNPNILFAKLPPGRYTLEVKCTNGDKVWSKSVYSLCIDVAYPWWLSVPAIIVYLLLAIVIIYIVQSVIRNRIRLNREILLEKVEKQHQQKLHESKLDFFTNVAHEFFTPLTLIYGPAQHLLEGGNLDEYTKRYIQIIKNNAERMQKLISELMEFRKAKTGHTSLHPECIDIRLLIDYVSDNYEDIAEENKIDYCVNSRELSTLFTDRDSVEKILFNLFSNAFKYTPRNGYIYVDVWQDVDNLLHFTIRNSGTGLTEQQMAEMFNKYKIFDAPPKTSNAVSTGIGLNLTKSLCELLGGEVSVTSEYGEYVEFQLLVPPLQTDAANVILPEIEKQEGDNVKGSDVVINKSIHILVVEDEKNIRELLRDILEPVYTVTEARDGEEAWTKINQNHPDMIITDILMPNLDGISLIDRLKENQKTVYIPIISISAKTSVEDHINAYKHGADLYITKPFHPRHVLSTIENLIARQVSLKKYFNSGISSMRVRDGLTIHQDDEKMIDEIAAFVYNNMDDESLNPNAIAEFMSISKATLYRKLKDITDKTPSEFVRSIRLEHASKLLLTTKLTVLEIMFKSGFTNKSYFYREFAKQYELSPKEYRDWGQE